MSCETKGAFVLLQQVIFLNRELVERGFAEWDVPADS